MYRLTLRPNHTIILYIWRITNNTMCLSDRPRKASSSAELTARQFCPAVTEPPPLEGLYGLLCVTANCDLRCDGARKTSGPDGDVQSGLEENGRRSRLPFSEIGRNLWRYILSCFAANRYLADFFNMYDIVLKVLQTVMHLQYCYSITCWI